MLTQKATFEEEKSKKKSHNFIEGMKFYLKFTWLRFPSLPHLATVSDDVPRLLATQTAFVGPSHRRHCGVRYDAPFLFCSLPTDSFIWPLKIVFHHKWSLATGPVMVKTRFCGEGVVFFPKPVDSLIK